MVRLGSSLCKNAKTLNRDSSSKTALVVQLASEFNLEVELKISFSSPFAFLSFHTALGHSRRVEPAASPAMQVASEPEALLAVLKNPAYQFKRIGLDAGPFC
jgi:hypothetical protein